VTADTIPVVELPSFVASFEAACPRAYAAYAGFEAFA